METLDQDVVNIAKAIRQSESGGDFKAKGKSGEHGAYQFTPDTWNAQAPKYGIKVPIEQATPQQQNEVAYRKIKEWKDSGKNVGQVASMWNAGELEPDAYLGKFTATTPTHKAGDPAVGVNKFGAKYDVPAYAKSVATAYQTLKKGGQVNADPNNPSSVVAPKEDLTKGTIIPTTTTSEPQSRHTGFLGTDPNDSLYGKLIDNPLTRGIMNVGNFLTFGGAKQLGDEVGKSTNIIAQKTKGLLGGKDYSQYSEQPDAGQAILGGLKTVAGVGSLAVGGGATKAAISKVAPSPLKSAAVKEVVQLGKGETIGNLTRKELMTTLENSLKEMKVSQIGTKYEKQILEAIKSLSPELKQSLLKRLTKSGFNFTKNLALTKILGDTVGGFIDKNTP